MKARMNAALARAAAEEVRRAGVDGWLLYDLEARNKVSAGLVGLFEGLSRRWFVLLRPDRPPRALAHSIEASHWDAWEHELETYSGWEEMEAALARLLEGCETVAMEVSPRDAVPFLDNVPAGVVELVREAGAEVVSSAPLVSRTYAQWGEDGRRLHRQAAEALARIAREAFARACRAVGHAGAAPEEGEPAGAVEEAVAGADAPGGGARDACVTGPAGAEPPALETEHDLAEWIRAAMARAGLVGGDTIVGVGENTAKPHYFPSAEEAVPLAADRVLLIDLWGRLDGEPSAVFADQTWMGWLGPVLPEEVAGAWEAVREAREAAIARLSRDAGGDYPTGAEVDRAARGVLEAHGFGDAVQHRTGHAMDRVNHGFGPNLDAFETRDERRLVPGIGFSVEPGIYLDGRFGLRSEVNVHLTDEGPEVTPARRQARPWTAARGSG